MGAKEHRVVDEELRRTLKENIQRRMDERWPGLKNQPRKLAAAAGVSLSTVQRCMACENTTIDTVGAIARVFKIPAYKLLIKVEEQRFFIDAREVVAAQSPQRDVVHSSQHRTPGSRR